MFYVLISHSKTYRLTQQCLTTLHLWKDKDIDVYNVHILMEVTRLKVLLYSSAVVAVIALVVIAIALIQTAKAVKKAMKDITDTVQRVELKIGGITEQTDRLMNQTNQIAEGANDRLQSVDGLTASAKELSESMNYVQHSLTKMADQVAAPTGKYANLMQQTTALSEVASRIYYNVKQKKGER